MAWTSPRTWVAGEVVTAALLNTHLRDNLQALGDPGAWTAFTPTVTQTAAITLTGNASAWKALGKTIYVRFNFGINSAGTAGAALLITLPTAAASTSALEGCGKVDFHDATGGAGSFYQLGVRPNASTTQISLIYSQAGSFFGNNPGVTVAAADFVAGHLIYEGA